VWDTSRKLTQQETGAMSKLKLKLKKLQIDTLARREAMKAKDKEIVLDIQVVIQFDYSYLTL